MNACGNIVNKLSYKVTHKHYNIYICVNTHTDIRM